MQVITLDALEKVVNSLRDGLESLENFETIISGVSGMDYSKALEDFSVYMSIDPNSRNKLFLNVRYADSKDSTFSIGLPVKADLSNAGEVIKEIVSDFSRLYVADDCDDIFKVFVM